MVIQSIIYNLKQWDLSKDIKEIKDILNKENINIGIGESKLQEKYMIKIYCDEAVYNDKVKKIIEYSIAEIIYKKIVNNYYDEGLEEFLSDSYFFLNFEEIMEIRYKIYEELNFQKELTHEDSIYFLRIKSRIIEKIVECIRENKEFNLEGYLFFRTRGISKDFSEIVDKIIERYMVEKEYNEFINLLKYFVRLQENKMDTINIFVKEDGDYLLFNEKYENIDNEVFKVVTENKFTGVAKMEDIIISMLISNCPKKIILHNTESCLNREFLETIKAIFEEAVEICDNCQFNEERIKNNSEVNPSSNL